ncbi:8-amino-7-oxononanoate synthase [Paraburkholderia ribeironis]|uniref:8-amino-7-oxononanoate synthase n=1 Tax=Paraburkholderia ribeironis TaxID=1247936 RepID=A0A1N7SP83_9BURK|nr:aminotransferase class I/II-fold pyridoxal phosphate-dependent enzyme [Paraburkholderia ribeironis]SIT49234.1 8-amino-7-oxononanoate synthase [Paraburkholderia ribeironis]
MSSIHKIDSPTIPNERIYQNTTGTLMMHLKRAGVRDVDTIAEQMDDLRQQQLSEGIYSFDSFSCLGSDASSPIATSLNQAPHDCVIWSTNLYLGLNRHPQIIEKVVDAVQRFGTGCGTSAISGGMNILHKKIEAKLQQWLGKESVMLFPTGFTANMGALAALCQENDHVLIDEESHASIRDGIRLSPTRRWISFGHNSIEDLQRKLEFSQRECTGKIIVVVESAYSMSGDICPLAELVALKRCFNFLIFVDEAHSFGLYGEGGRGLCYQENVIDQVDFIASTFSKAAASIGGFVTTERRFVSYFQWSSNAYAFQACFTPADAAAVLAALEVIETSPDIARTLHEKNAYMRLRLKRAGFDLRSSQTPIVPIYISDTEKLLKICFELYKRGVFSVPVAYPMVGANDGRIRLIVNVRHSYEQIDRTVDLLDDLAKEFELFNAKDMRTPSSLSNI